MNLLLLGEASISGFCNETKDILRLVGIVITLLKIFIPFLIIIFGMIDFGKAVVASKDEQIKESAKSLGRRAVAGLIIFFIPSLVVWIFGAVTSFGEDKDGFSTCEECLLHPFGKCN